MTINFSDELGIYRELKDLTEQADKLVYFGGKNGKLNLSILGKINDEISILISEMWEKNYNDL